MTEKFVWVVQSSNKDMLEPIHLWQPVRAERVTSAIYITAPLASIVAITLIGGGTSKWVRGLVRGKADGVRLAGWVVKLFRT